MKFTAFALILSATSASASIESRSIYPTPEGLAIYVLAQEPPPAPAIPEPSRFYRILGLMNYGLRGTEIVATEVIIGQGGQELNPFMQNRNVRMSAGFAAPIVVNWGSELVRKNGHPKWALLIRVVTVSLWSYAVAHNLGEIR